MSSTHTFMPVSSAHPVGCFIAPDLLSCSYAIFQQEEEEVEEATAAAN